MSAEVAALAIVRGRPVRFQMYATEGSDAGRSATREELLPPVPDSYHQGEEQDT